MNKGEMHSLKLTVKKKPTSLQIHLMSQLISWGNKFIIEYIYQFSCFFMIQGSLNKVPDFFIWALLLIVHTWNSSPLQSNLLWLQCTCCTIRMISGSPHGSPLLWACQWPSPQSLSSPQLSHNDSLWAYGITKSHREQGLDYREGEELYWYPSLSNSLWQGWSCGLVHCPCGNATDPIWRVLASSNGISSWTPLKPQHRNPNPNPLANQLWCIDFLTPPTPLSLKHSIRFCSIFSKFTTEFYCISFFLSVLTSGLHFWNSPAVTIGL